MFIFILTLFLHNYTYSQEQRLSDHNSIGWLAYTGTLKIHPKIALHTEYQWRRVDGLKNPQQSLLPTGVNYALRKDVSLNAGYAFAETDPYGDYPNANAFSEHRMYEQIVLKNPIGKVEVSHRFTLEQRFLEKFITQNGVTNTDWVFLNRMRYRLRTEISIYKNSTDNNSVSIILLDEVFVGFGKNVGANVFDQNRLAALVGYKVNKNVKIEAGYLSQILQQGKRVNDKSVFQYNNGFMLTTHLSFDAVK
ncbi:DUF2490 domain-containing protein [Flavobacterium sandaracinum]|uniref:DUF2490 domain-containing protein n=3 Tax=Flavobacterium TaxID=237 RepID=A0A4R5CU88_9FLAO|nr:uncharacterized protein DUF2490 [Flavobacterium sp. 11]RBN49024.1 DUF2490 domain-containing protein [Flavobacterium psychrolimnae]TDD77229.1 DUF2490 domain-containing protein [Flavobacterium caseinilyticum]TDE04242.1 DUF2490 domain-containing protein [Flavobacterium sandaracinum]